MQVSRRKFIRQSALAAAAIAAAPVTGSAWAALPVKKSKVLVSGHLWVYASKFPPDWDSTPVLNTVFSDMKFAGLDGVEVMESNLRHLDAVSHFSDLIAKYSLPVTGSSYNNEFWNKDKKQLIVDDVSVLVEKLHQLKASTFGITVGDAGHVKTDAELDAQADLVKMVFKLCADKNIQANLHNHTFEVDNGMHDLKGTLARFPQAKLGPDLNWLVRGGVDPVWFIKTYGHQMVYMHIRDQYADGKWTEYVGQGVTDFPAIAKTLNDINYKGRAAIELAFDSPPVNPLRNDWKMSRDYVHKVFGW